MSTQSAHSITIPVSVSVPLVTAIPAEVRETAERLGVAKYWQLVVDLTHEIYGGFSDVTVSEDPEFDDTHIIFHASVDCSVEEALEKDDKWGLRMMEIIPRSPQVYLVFAVFPS